MTWEAPSRHVVIFRIKPYRFPKSGRQQYGLSDKLSVMVNEPLFLRGAKGAAFSGMLIGLTGLAGWVFNIALLKSIVAGFIAMKANTAICLTLLSVALVIQCEPANTRARIKIARLLSLFVAAVSALTLVQWIAGLNFGIDELLFVDNTVINSSDLPGRMAVSTAVCLCLCGLALVLREDSRPAQWAVAVALPLAWLAVTGYVFDVKPLHQIVGYASMAVHTAVAIVLLGLGIMAARSHRSLARLLSSDTGGGSVARTLLSVMPVAMMFMNWLILQGEQADLYDSRFALAISFVSSAVLMVAMVMFVSFRLIASELHRDQAMAELAVLNRDLEKIVDQRTQDLTRVNQKLTQEIAERELAEQQVRQLSLTDELTGVLNRRGFMLLAEQAIKTAKRTEADIVLIYFDLDDLKRVNDTFGHQAGDDMIANAAEILKQTFRESDLVARIGGDEFTVLAVGGESPKRMLGRLQEAVREFNAQHPELPPLAFSQGTVRCFAESDKSLLQLLAEADALMYQEKRLHRQQRQPQLH